MNSNWFWTQRYIWFMPSPFWTNISWLLHNSSCNNNKIHFYHIIVYLSEVRSSASMSTQIDLDADGFFIPSDFFPAILNLSHMVSFVIYSDNSFWFRAKQSFKCLRLVWKFFSSVIHLYNINSKMKHSNESWCNFQAAGTDWEFFIIKNYRMNYFELIQDLTDTLCKSIDWWKSLISSMYSIYVFARPLHLLLLIFSWFQRHQQNHLSFTTFRRGRRNMKTNNKIQ